MDSIFFITILVFSVIIHEIAHGYVADILGDPTARLAGRLTINPLPHIDLIGSIILPAILIFTGSGAIIGWAKPVPYNPYNLRDQRWGTLAVSIAGIGANFLIAIVFGLIIRFGTGLPEAFLSLAQVVVIMNIVLGIFNLLPIPPLDGSKVLLALFPRWFYPIQEFAERNFFLVIFILLFLLPTVFGPFVGGISSFIFRLFTGGAL